MNAKDKRFSVIKSSPDGMSGGSGAPVTLEEAGLEIGFIKGWDSREAFLAALAKWAEWAEPGDFFKTYASLIVCARPDAREGCPCCSEEEDIDFGDFDVDVADWSVLQHGHCNACGANWTDRFARVSTLVTKKGKTA